MLQAFLFGLLGGALRVLLGFHAATVSDKNEKFNWTKAVTTVLLGGLIGLVAKPVLAFLGVPAELVNSDAGLGLVVVVAAFGAYAIQELFPTLEKRLREVLPLHK